MGGKPGRYRLCPHTTLRSAALWLSPPRRQRQGCFAWAGPSPHILTVVSSEAEAIIEGSLGDVAKSLIS